jgi:hypothetical protein
LVKELAALRQQTTTASYTLVSNHSGTGRPAEQAAMKLLPPQNQRELEAVKASVQETSRLPDGEERVRLIAMVFWRQSHTLAGAALELHMSYRSAQRRHNDFILLVGANLGLVEKMGHKSQENGVQ